MQHLGHIHHARHRATFTPSNVTARATHTPVTFSPRVLPKRAVLFSLSARRLFRRVTPTAYGAFWNRALRAVGGFLLMFAVIFPLAYAVLWVALGEDAFWR